MPIAVLFMLQCFITQYQPRRVEKMMSSSHNDTKIKSACIATLASAAVVLLTAGCSTKNYVRSQTAPIIQQTNELDAKTAADHKSIVDTDERAQKGIAGAQS